MPLDISFSFVHPVFLPTHSHKRNVFAFTNDYNANCTGPITKIVNSLKKKKRFLSHLHFSPFSVLIAAALLPSLIFLLFPLSSTTDHSPRFREFCLIIIAV